MINESEESVSMCVCENTTGDRKIAEHLSHLQFNIPPNFCLPLRGRTLVDSSVNSYSIGHR
jgi:hypothetical protein